MNKKIVTLLSSLVIASTIAVPSVNAAESTSDAEIGFNAGNLSITSVGGFQFQKDTVSSGAMTVPNPTDFSINLEDETGTGNGWNLKAKLSNFTHTASDGTVVSTNALPGASLKLDGGTALSTLDGATVSGASVNQGIVIAAGAETSYDIVSANANADLKQAGIGPWTVNWAANQTVLDIPAATAFSTSDTEKVAGTVTWTLATGGPTGDTTVTSTP